MTDVAELAGRQLGPLPLGAWGLAVAGGLAVAFVVRRNALNNSSTSDASSDTGDEYGSTQPGTTPATTSSGTPTFADNSEWQAAAVRRLIGDGYDPTAASAAIARWLEGIGTTITERAMVSRALQLIGPPPVAPAAPDAGTPQDSAPPRVTTPPAYPGIPSKPKPPAPSTGSAVKVRDVVLANRTGSIHPTPGGPRQPTPRSPEWGTAINKRKGK